MTRANNAASVRTRLVSSILLVEDDESLRSLLAMILTDAGYQVDTARDGLTALTVLEETAVALIVLDMNLPNLNGWDVARAARAAGIQAPVIMMSGGTEPAGWAASIQAADYLAKPFSMEDLLRVVQRALGH